MSATSWVPAYDQKAGAVKVVAAHVNTGVLDTVFRQPFLPVAVTPLAEWLMEDAGYTPPPGPRVVWPPDQGRGYPPVVAL